MDKSGKTARKIKNGSAARHNTNKVAAASHNRERSGEASHHKLVPVPAHFGGKRSRALRTFQKRHTR